MAHLFLDDNRLGLDGKELLDKYSITINDMGGGVEPYYFTILRLLRGVNIKKIKDIFAASEMSSFWGDLARRRSEQESRAMQLMGTLNGMLKDLFKVMREASILDERLKLYEGFKSGTKADDYALKDVWISLVEGGAKNPSSVIGLATQVGFVSLPDYFYMTHVLERSKINEAVSKYDLSKKFSQTLERKLEQFLLWKERTESELKTRKKFVTGMLKTIVSEIRVYAEWVRPYIRSINKLKNAEVEKPELVTAFETSFLDIELEIIPQFEGKDPYGDYQPVGRLKFSQTTSPAEVYQRNYQRGFVHRGNVKIGMEGWIYTKKQYAKERSEKNEELIDFLIKNVDESIQSMRDDLKKLLDNDFKVVEEKPEKPAKPVVVPHGFRNFVDQVFPFVNIFIPKREKKEEKKMSFIDAFNPKFQAEKAKEFKAAMSYFEIPIGSEREEMEKGAKLYSLYKTFKAINRMLGPPS